jgi:hypothetical protein
VQRRAWGAARLERVAFLAPASQQRPQPPQHYRPRDRVTGTLGTLRGGGRPGLGGRGPAFEQGCLHDCEHLRGRELLRSIHDEERGC